MYDTKWPKSDGTGKYDNKMVIEVVEIHRREFLSVDNGATLTTKINTIM